VVVSWSYLVASAERSATRVNNDCPQFSADQFRVHLQLAWKYLLVSTSGFGIGTNVSSPIFATIRTFVSISVAMSRNRIHCLFLFGNPGIHTSFQYR
jgi:hypothetical protein